MYRTFIISAWVSIMLSKTGVSAIAFVHLRDCPSSQHHLRFTSSCQIIPPADYVLLMLFQRNGRRRSKLVVIGCWRARNTDRTRRSDLEADRRPMRICSVWRAPSDSWRSTRINSISEVKFNFESDRKTLTWKILYACNDDGLLNVRVHIEENSRKFNWDLNKIIIVK
jgi:hypothetical protein